jgi:hypothetical protein
MRRPKANYVQLCGDSFFPQLAPRYRYRAVLDVIAPELPADERRAVLIILGV